MYTLLGEMVPISMMVVFCAMVKEMHSMFRFFVVLIFDIIES